MPGIRSAAWVHSAWMFAVPMAAYNSRACLVLRRAGASVAARDVMVILRNFSTPAVLLMLAS